VECAYYVAGYENISCRPFWENYPESPSCSAHNIIMIAMCSIILLFIIILL